MLMAVLRLMEGLPEGIGDGMAWRHREQSRKDIEL